MDIRVQLKPPVADKLMIEFTADEAEYFAKVLEESDRYSARRVYAPAFRQALATLADVSIA